MNNESYRFLALETHKLLAVWTLELPNVLTFVDETRPALIL